MLRIHDWTLKFFKLIDSRLVQSPFTLLNHTIIKHNHAHYITPGSEMDSVQFSSAEAKIEVLAA